MKERILDRKEEQKMVTKYRRMRRISRRDFLKMGAGAAGALTLAGCAPKVIPTPAPIATSTPAPAPTATPVPTPTPVVPGAKYGGTFTLGQSTDLQDWSPYHHGTMMYMLFQAIWSPVVFLNPSTGSFEPALAESWDVKPDGTSVTLELRKGVLFHSGREFTAEDVVRSLELRKSKEAADNFGVITDRAVEAKALDKYTARIDFDPPTGPIVPWLETLFIVDHETWEDPERAGGTGPFRVEEYVPGVGVTMVRFEDYWEEGLPFVDSYVTQVIPDRATLGIKFEEGEIDGCKEMDEKDYARWRENPEFITHPGSPGYSVCTIQLSFVNEPVNNKKLRQAIAHAIDRERFVETILNGIGYATDVILPPNHPAYPADLAGTLDYDLDKARELVVEAGFGDGVDIEFQVSSAFWPALGGLAQIVADDLGKIGVNVKISDLESIDWLSRYRAQEFQMSVLTPSRQNKDPAICFAGAKIFWPDPERYTQFYDEEYAQLFDEILQETDAGKRAEIFHRMTEIMQDACCQIPVAPQEHPFAVQNYVKNFEVEDDLGPYVGRLYLDKS